VVVTQGAVKLAEAARQLDAKLDPRLPLRDPARAQIREEVFLAQLHELALVLNDGFQSQILQILLRHESQRVENQAVQNPDVSPESNVMGSARVPSADLMFRSNSGSAVADSRRNLLQNASKSNFSASMSRLGAYFQKTESTAHSVSALTASEHLSTSTDTAVVLLQCIFDDGIGAVEVHPAPVKT